MTVTAKQKFIGMILVGAYLLLAGGTVASIASSRLSDYVIALTERRLVVTLPRVVAGTFATPENGQNVDNDSAETGETVAINRMVASGEIGTVLASRVDQPRRTTTGSGSQGPGSGEEPPETELLPPQVSSVLCGIGVCL